MENTKYRVLLQIGESKFEIESHDSEWVKSKEKEYLKVILENISTSTKHKKENVSAQTSFTPKNLTINEFYKNHIKTNNVKSRPDMAVFFIYYIQKILNKNDIKTQDVKQCFADISYPNYNKLNITDILNQSKRKALLNSVDDIWSLTITGEDYVLSKITSDK